MIRLKQLMYCNEKDTGHHSLQWETIFCPQIASDKLSKAKMTTSTVPDHPLPHLADKLDAINRTLLYMKVDQKSATSSLHFLVLRSTHRQYQTIFEPNL